jgi:NAD(P)-dependent dehydrogenase (short-subunit alcohol dehydrogenase family)
LEDTLRVVRSGIETHLVTSRYAVPLMVARRAGLIVEVTDGVSDDYRGQLPYDLVKSAVIRLAKAQAAELAPRGVTAVALTPGFLRSESMLEHFGVTSETWRDAIAKDRHFAASETPTYIGRAVAALAGDPDVGRFSGRALSTWGLSKEYDFTDADGTRPDWGAHFAEHVAGS